MTIQDELAALPRNPKYPIRHPDDVEPYRTNRILRHVMDERDALAAHLVLAERLLRGMIGIPAVCQILGGKHTAGCDCPLCRARAYLAHREAE